MTNPHSADELLSLATPYALHAVSDSEAADIDRQLAGAPPEVAEAFAAEVRAVRETMAVISAATAVEPPSHLRGEILRQISDDNVRTLPPQPRERRWSRAVLAGAAAVAIGLGALVVGYTLRPPATPTTAEEIFAAPDVRTVSGDIPGGGTATVVFSREENAGVLVMNNVTPPQAGTVYQMWLIDSDGPHPAGTMDSGQVAPSTTAVLPDLGTSQTLAFTVEPPGGSTQPTSPVFAQLPLV
ncbi:anti-sigma factor domain-containing protein [Mycolicibacterium iranicum]|uniref:Anti-sigma-K factor RskA n=1 Tax=Mycolicibacterium iranicum TaxID=912594 RepID=A0A1X1WYD9_MYCIR|nr:anti-sigma factor [Mycolicibacterium iranicum]MCZ0732230.1 anti-sigma factor [Mycolicibacterium iranicum]ORV91508.1 anti-sigma factor [Mycolicibacterium iranicum]